MSFLPKRVTQLLVIAAFQTVYLIIFQTVTTAPVQAFVPSRSGSCNLHTSKLQSFQINGRQINLKASKGEGNNEKGLSTEPIISINSANGYVFGDNSNGFSTFGGQYNTVLVKKKKQSERRTKRQKLTNRLLNAKHRQRRQRLKNEDDDGYSKMMQKSRPLYRRIMRAPFKLAKRVLFPEIGKEPGTLILVRHGESTWNYNKTFTGWADPDLSERGYREIEHAARLLLEGGYEIDVVFTSRLKRAIRSVWILLQELNQVYLPVFKSWRLNERMYGALTGLSKTETAAQLGTSIVQEWRGSLRSRPPPLKTTDQFWPGNDRKHFDLSPDQIPLTESLYDCMERTAPMWEDKITYELRKGRNVLVVAHANTLRGLVKIIDDIGDDEIQDIAIPTGIPIVYKFNNIKELVPINHYDDNYSNTPSSTNGHTGSQMHMTGLFLEKPGLLKEALKREEEWRSRIPGYDYAMTRSKKPMTALERSLTKLRAERELGEWAGQFIDPDAEFEDDGSDGNFGKPIAFIDHGRAARKDYDNEEDRLWEVGMLLDSKERNANTLISTGTTSSNNGASGAQDNFSNQKDPVPSKLKKNKILSEDEDDDVYSPTIITNNPCQKPLPLNETPGSDSVPIRQDSVIVMIRHGKTEHNKLGLFTGWEDAPLAPEGVEEAKQAGKLLKAHGFEFDLVYTSWLSRAIETAWLVIDELDCIWLPIIKTWRLNERMYGDLTGLSKQMVKQRHGEKQFKAWRRGYKVRPPPVSSFSTNYPGNDQRYTKFMKDVRYSIGETLIRSIEGGDLKLQRKFPKSESLKDCMERTIPYFSHQIVPEAINNGKRVLIASSENAIRGLLMHLCEIPEERIVELEIPNGLPLIFDTKSKCVKLLDDGTGRDPLEVYNFGKAANYLFKPCTDENGLPDEECEINFNSGSFIASDADMEVIESIKRPAPIWEEEKVIL